MAIGGEVAGVDIPGLNFDEPLYLEFEAEGSDYTARVYDEQGGTLRAEVTGFDDTRPADPGVTGLVVSAQSATSLELLGVWDDVTAMSLDVMPVDGDFNDDGVTNIVDALIIARCEAGIPSVHCPNV